ncbi:MAG TPA: phospholipid carrier-dependent glycosyltransferase [Arthrobacter bacterium]|jgi:dolichyl-phosphate-mannose--protein O-mannosyl transferase|nr:phospholipid carrier-dependent glycosyltransferase [Arthrobacter sp.]HAP90411.1 phospholipid carrier-dependent glycosyltransferase [Arthrobacter sp.]HBH58185.1 phospholipid carrier-dependent glycosyltransferase [Arthrobacter sp.]HCB58869.1 phospholipid carrier-dependent glycosyltransferase [Arthrobacter sp.]HCC41390.1 phospholipid carrier-dependent glycosyltransferase [Arthrobacter sp.]
MGLVTQTSMRPAEACQPNMPAPGPWITRPAEAFAPAALRERLIGSVRSWRDYPPSLRFWFWLVPVLTSVIGGILRFVRLDTPHSLVFDETYYVKDAYSYLVSGYERNWPDKANDSFNAGNPAILLDTPEYVVHPPVGKWMIAGGMWLFGSDNPFGWRFAAALTGTASILLLTLIALKLFRSLPLAAAAGLLLAVDGHHLVMSRTSLLDIFLMFWILAAFGALLLDRDDGRRRLAARLGRLAAENGRPPAGRLLAGPWLGIRWWRVAAGVCLGLAVGTKWSGLFFLAGFGVLTVLWDLNARRVAGIRGWISGGIIKDGLPAFASMVPVATLVYTATWTGWFLSDGAYFRRWAQSNPSAEWGWLPDSLRSLAHYHLEAYKFHQGLTSDHPYAASAWSWLVMGRPTSFFYQKPEQGAPGCDVPDCASAILSVGNPMIWWGAAISLVVLLFWWAGRRDWRAGAILAGVGVGYLPWFLYPERTMFFFYAVSFEPFLVLALVYCLGLVLGRDTDPLWRRRSGVYLVALFIAGAILLSAFFYPVWSAETIPYQEWRYRMWMPSWI